MDDKNKIESIGLVYCELGNDACYFCENPDNGIYAQRTGLESEDIAYYICGKCALEKIKSGVEHCKEIVVPKEKDIGEGK